MNSIQRPQKHCQSFQAKSALKVKSLLILFFTIFLSTNVVAQQFERPFKIMEPEIIDRYKELYKNRATGDSYDPATGAVTFAVTDISIPGNSTIPVELSRWIPSDDLKTGGFGVAGGW